MNEHATEVKATGAPRRPGPGGPSPAPSPAPSSAPVLAPSSAPAPAPSPVVPRGARPARRSRRTVRRSAGREHRAGAGRWDSRRDVRGAPRALTREVTDVARTAHVVHLYSRPHIDLQRVAGALCRS
ncbi:putative leader peptide [Streptomyces fumanus]|uniref:putative leader peptide n=1 Tax=Streptomyces fumanus TaxID=67302 RepID=UPI0033FE05E0